MMQTTEIRKAQSAVPFRPFVIHLADGSSFYVDHPELVAVLRSGRTVVYEHPEGGIQLLDAVMVTRLEVLGPRAGGPP